MRRELKKPIVPTATVDLNPKVPPPKCASPRVNPKKPIVYTARKGSYIFTSLITPVRSASNSSARNRVKPTELISTEPTVDFDHQRNIIVCH